MENSPASQGGWPRAIMALLLALTVQTAAGCSLGHRPVAPERPNVAPATQPADVKALALDASQIEPMYTEMVAVDLPSVVQVAVARNVDVLLARQAVIASRGEFESRIGAAFPAIVPTALFDHVEGTVRATEGNLVGVGFNTFQPSVAVQWVINPGRVIYDMIAAKKRLFASEYREKAVIQETLRSAVNRYYDLVLTQARVSAAHQSVGEAEELLRITRLATQTGTGVRADELRAEARLAARSQDLVVSMREFYDASVALAVTLRLEAHVTLVPNLEELPPVHLVRADLTIHELLDIALTFRPDLDGVRMLAQAAAAESGSTWWGAFGPQVQASYRYGGITGHANNVVDNEGIPGNLIVNPGSSSGTFSPNPAANGLIKEGILRGSKRLAGHDDQTYSFSDQQQFSAGVGWRLSLSAFGELKKADARKQQAAIRAEGQLDQVKAQVVAANVASRTQQKLMGLSRQQVVAAAEALRLSEANLRAGAMTTLDVLQAQDAVSQARLRQAEAVVYHNQSQVNLLAALGLLNEDTLIGPASHRSGAVDVSQ